MTFNLDRSKPKNTRMLSSPDSFLRQSQGSTVLQLLERVQQRFNGDDESASNSLPHYKELQQYNHIESKAHSRQAMNNPKPPLPTPLKLSPNALKSLLDISSSLSLSSWSEEDTSAAPEMASWLHRISQGNWTPDVSKTEFSLLIEDLQSMTSGKNFSPFHVNTDGQDNDSVAISPLFGHHKTTPRRNCTPTKDIKLTPYPRSLLYELPRVPSNGDVESNVAPLSVRPRVVRFQTPKFEHSPINRDDTHSPPSHRGWDEGVSDSSSTDMHPGESFEYSVQNALDPCYDLSPTDLPQTPFPDASWITTSPEHNPTDLVSSIEADKSNMLLQVTRDLQADAEFHQDVASLADLSSIYVNNLALQHSAKSPFLIRNWQRVLDELTGRNQFVQSSEPYHPKLCSSPGSQENIQMITPSSCTSELVDLYLDEDNHQSQDHSNAEIPAYSTGYSHPSYSYTNHQTRADQALDQEYVTLLRASISTKKREIEFLHQLLSQRQQTVHCLERVLSRKTADMLIAKNHSSLDK